LPEQIKAYLLTRDWLFGLVLKKDVCASEALKDRVIIAAGASSLSKNFQISEQKLYSYTLSLQ